MASLENVNFEVMRTAGPFVNRRATGESGNGTGWNASTARIICFLIVRRGRNRRFDAHMPLQHSPHPTGVIGLC